MKSIDDMQLEKIITVNNFLATFNNEVTVIYHDTIKERGFLYVASKVSEYDTMFIRPHINKTFDEYLHEKNISKKNIYKNFHELIKESDRAHYKGDLSKQIETDTVYLSFISNYNLTRKHLNKNYQTTETQEEEIKAVFYRTKSPKTCYGREHDYLLSFTDYEIRAVFVPMP